MTNTIIFCLLSMTFIYFFSKRFVIDDQNLKRISYRDIDELIYHSQFSVSIEEVMKHFDVSFLSKKKLEIKIWNLGFYVSEDGNIFEQKSKSEDFLKINFKK